MAYRFDFALSFAGASRPLARELAERLTKLNFTVFFDEDYQHELLGTDGSAYLRDIYSNQSRYCVVLITKEYDQRTWTQLERESIQAREIKGESGVLLPVLVDGHRPGWLPQTRIYFDLSRKSPAELADVLHKKASVSLTHPSLEPAVATATREEAVSRQAESDFSLRKFELEQSPIPSEQLKKLQDNIEREYRPFLVLQTSINLRVEGYILPIIRERIRIETELRRKNGLPFTADRITAIKLQLEHLVLDDEWPAVINAGYADAVRHVDRHFPGPSSNYKIRELEDYRDKRLKETPERLLALVDTMLQSAMAESILANEKSSSEGAQLPQTRAEPSYPYDSRSQPTNVSAPQENETFRANSSPETEPSNVVFSLHGIKTRGKWQKDVTPLLSQAGFTVVPLDYGYFLALQLLMAGAREKKVDWFRDQYTQQCARLQCDRPSIIAHSLGSYLVAQSIEKYPQIRIDRAIFCGAIIRRDFPWKEISNRGQVKNVLNQFGGRDLWARLVEWVVRDAGQSGLRGFADSDGPVRQQWNPKFRHSDYFYDLNFKENWIAFLRGQDVKETPPANPPLPNWRFRVTRSIVTLALLAAAAFAVWSAIKHRTNHSSSTQPSAPIVIDDVIVHSNGKGNYDFDFRVRNTGASDLLINRVSLERLGISGTVSALPYSDKVLTPLEICAGPVRAKASQPVNIKLKPGEADRFAVTATCAWTDWGKSVEVKPTLDTSAGPLDYRPISISMAPISDDQSEMMNAVQSGNSTRVDALLRAHPDLHTIDALNGFGTTDILYQAAGDGYAEIVQSLLKAIPRPYNATRLNLAAGVAVERGHIAVVSAFLAAGVSPNALQHIPADCWKQAADDVMTGKWGENGRTETYVINNMHLNCGVSHQQNGVSLLHKASYYGNSAVVKLLLRAGANPQVVDEKGRTPVDYAAEKHRNEITRLLKRALHGTSNN